MLILEALALTLCCHTHREKGREFELYILFSFFFPYPASLEPFCDANAGTRWSLKATFFVTLTQRQVPLRHDPVGIFAGFFCHPGSVAGLGWSSKLCVWVEG